MHVWVNGVEICVKGTSCMNGWGFLQVVTGEGAELCSVSLSV